MSLHTIFKICHYNYPVHIYGYWLSFNKESVLACIGDDNCYYWRYVANCAYTGKSTYKDLEKYLKS